jgi:hypothetical protein
MSAFDPLRTLGLHANLGRMTLWRAWTDRIKREVTAEGPTGWLVGGGYVVRRVKGLTLLLPAVAALFFLRDGLLQHVIVWGFFAAWAVYTALTWAVGTFFIGKKIDRYIDTKVRPNPSTKYRKR